LIKKTIELGTAGTRLSVKHRQLVVERPEMPKATLPIEDLGVVIIDDRQCIMTQAVLIALMDAGATLIVTGRDHLPAGMMLPLDAHHVQTERHRAQVEASEPVRKRVWQAIVRAKIRQQAEVLSHFQGQHHGLVPMAARVRSGDPDNLEAQAAQRYWPKLFGADFRRDRDAGGINALLNYGYAVMRAATARAVVGAGLIPSLGVYHKNRGNPFCLADDLLEPYRPFVDWRVRQMIDGDSVPALDQRDTKARLLGLLSETIRVGERRTPVLLALHHSAASLCRALTAIGHDTASAADGAGRPRAPRLALPEGMPLDPDLLADGGGAA